MKPIMTIMTVVSLVASTAALAQTAPSVPAPTRDDPSRSVSPATTPPEIIRTRPEASVGVPQRLSEAEARDWMGKPVYSQDEKNVGDVAFIQRDPSGAIIELYADVGGFLGLGSTRVKLVPSQFTLAGDRIVLRFPAEQVKELPKIAK